MLTAVTTILFEVLSVKTYKKPIDSGRRFHQKV